jgi:hypothetical protein
MQTASLHADARADERMRARRILIERRLAQFQPPFRQRVAAFASRHPRLEDLVLSFPALLFALAVPQHGRERERARALVIDGASLRDAAAAARVPLWLRRLRPTMLRSPLPLLPDGLFISRQVLNHVPRSARRVSGWLDAISSAASVADDGVGVWMARVWQQRPPRLEPAGERGIALWAWYSRNVPDDPCRVGIAWSPGLSFCRALDHADEWRTNVSLYLKLGDEPLRDLWFGPGTVGPFEIVPLQTFDDVVGEAHEMKNCVRWYGPELVESVCRLWSIRRGGERVATFEVSQAHESPFAYVSQLKLVDDKPAPEGIWRIAQEWLRAQPHQHIGWRQEKVSVPPAQVAAWRRMWRPYWLAKRCIPPWLQLTPSEATIREL